MLRFGYTTHVTGTAYYSMVLLIKQECFASGHTESVLSVDSADWDTSLLASSSKDNSFLLWRVEKSDEDTQGPRILFVPDLSIGVLGIGS